MQITVNLPDDLAVPVLPHDQDPARAALEALGLEAYRQRRVSAVQLRTLLGLNSRFEFESFLKRHEVYDYSLADFDSDMAAIRELTEKRKAERRT